MMITSLVTFDLVADPSTKGAFPGLVNESNNSAFIQDDYQERPMIRHYLRKFLLECLENKLKQKIKIFNLLQHIHHVTTIVYRSLYKWENLKQNRRCLSQSCCPKVYLRRLVSRNCCVS